MAEEKTVKNGDVTQAAKPENGGNGHAESGLSLAKSEQESKGEIQVGTYAVAGLRPVASSSLQIYGTIANNRPVVASPLRVVSYAGNRPIFASEIMVMADLGGGRPVAASSPALMQPSNLPGGRPIAPNDIDSSEGLMGYLD